MLSWKCGKRTQPHFCGNAIRSWFCKCVVLFLCTLIGIQWWSNVFTFCRLLVLPKVITIWNQFAVSPFRSLIDYEWYLDKKKKITVNALMYETQPNYMGHRHWRHVSVYVLYVCVCVVRVCMFCMWLRAIAVLFPHRWLASKICQMIMQLVMQGLEV